MPEENNLLSKFIKLSLSAPIYLIAVVLIVMSHTTSYISLLLALISDNLLEIAEGNKRWVNSSYTRLLQKILFVYIFATSVVLFVIALTRLTLFEKLVNLFGQVVLGVNKYGPITDPISYAIPTVLSLLFAIGWAFRVKFLKNGEGQYLARMALGMIFSVGLCILVVIIAFSVSDTSVLQSLLNSRGITVEDIFNIIFILGVTTPAVLVFEEYFREES
jgi:hypothetical protein